MFQKTQKIWLDGKLVPWDEAKVHVLTHTLHYGAGVFEGIRYYDCAPKGSAVFRLPEHIRRFEDSCKILALKLPYSAKELTQACLEVSRVNGLKEGYLRPLAFISEGPGAGLWAYDNPVRVTIVTYGWGAYLGADGLNNGIRARVSSITRHHPNISMTHGKICGHYVNSILAKREAKLVGYDEALMLDPEGFVAEGTAENIFMIRDGVARTPALGSILPGITRDTVMKLLREEGMPVVEEKITRDDFYVADEVFCTGTAAEITPIREIDDRTIGTGKPGEITKKLQKMYSTLVHGGDPRHLSWLTFVNQ